MGRIERQRTEKVIETIPLKLLFEEIINELASFIEKKEMVIIHKYDEEVVLEANSRLLEFVFKNFLSNAVKYSERGSEIVIDFKVSDHESIISVADKGVGISSENIDKIFSLNQNWKTHGTEGEYGTGLGLLASTRFADYFNAKINIESTPGEGSTFSLILPKYLA